MSIERSYNSSQARARKLPCRKCFQNSKSRCFVEQNCNYAPIPILFWNRVLRVVSFNINQNVCAIFDISTHTPCRPVAILSWNDELSAPAPWGRCGRPAAPQGPPDGSTVLPRPRGDSRKRFCCVAQPLWTAGGSASKAGSSSDDE